MPETPDDLRLIRAKYPGSCQACGRSLRKKWRVYHSRSERKIWCINCGRPEEGTDASPGKQPPRPKPSRVPTRQKPQKHGPNQERWEQLCGYLRDCVRAEAADTLAELRRYNTEWFLHPGGFELLVTGEADSIPIPEELARLAHRRQQPDPPMSVLYGWPTLVAPDTNNRLKVAPLFVLQVEVDAQKGKLLADSEPEFNVGVTAGQLFNPSVREEIKEIVGDGVPFGDRPSLMVLAARISEALSVEVHSELDPQKLEPRLGRNPGMYNAAISIASENSLDYVVSLLKELESLAKRTDWQDTAAACLLNMSGQRPVGERPSAEPLAAPLAANYSQEMTLGRLRTQPLTVIKGPPGTGKTQLVANAVGNAWLDGETILVTSTNNTAVDVAVDRANRDICPGVLFRTGKREVRENLKEIVLEATVEAGLVRRSEAKARGRLARAHAQRSVLLENLEKQTRLREDLLDVVEHLQGSAFEIWGRSRSPELPTSAHAVAHRADRLQRVWFFRRRRTRRLLRVIGATNPGVMLGKVKSWAAYEDRRQRLTRRLETIEAAIGSSEKAVGRADTEWAEASREAVQAVVASRLNPPVANLLRGVASRSRVFKRGIRDVMKHASGWACTALSMGQNFTLKPGLFDLVIIDEASQCSLAQALPLAYRAKRLAVVGDPNQLTPIVKLLPKVHERIATHAGLDIEELDRQGMHHRRGSAYLAFEHRARMRDPLQPFLLNEHYRCHPEIARWFNREFYDDQLTVLTDLERHTGAGLVPTERQAAVLWKPIGGCATRGQRGSWVNREEANQAVREATRYVSRGDLSVGVVTPFREQVQLVQRLAGRHLNEAMANDQFRCGTAHGFQGDERDVMIFSTVIAPGIGSYAADWIEMERNLLNVAASRARALLIVLGHPDIEQFGSPTLVSLRRYAIEELNAGQKTELEGRYRTDSRPEQLLLDAMRKAELDPVAKLNDSGYELDFAILEQDIRLNIEVDGDQHVDMRGQQRRQDIARDRVLTRAGWKVIRIPAWQCVWDTDAAVRSIKEALRENVIG